MNKTERVLYICSKNTNFDKLCGMKFETVYIDEQADITQEQWDQLRAGQHNGRIIRR